MAQFMKTRVFCSLILLLLTATAFAGPVENLIGKNQWQELSLSMQKEVFKHPWKKEAQMNLSLAHFKLGHKARAIEMLEAQAQKKPFIFEVYFNLGLIYQETQNLERAQWAMEVAHKIRPVSFDAALELARLYDRRENFKAANKIFNDLLRRHRQNVALILNYSHFLKRNRHFEEAENQMWTALALAPKSVFLNYEYSLLLEATGVRKENQALQLKLVLALDDDHKEARLKLAYLQLEMGHLADARENFEALVKRFPQYQAGHLGLARFLYAQKVYILSMERLVWAEKLGPSIEVLEEKAQVFMAMEKFDSAAIEYGKVSDLAPWKETAYLFRAKLFERLGMKVEAIREYKKGLSHVKKSLNLNLLLAHLLYAEGNFRDSMDYYEAALALSPLHERAHSQIARCALKLSEKAHGQKHLLYLDKIIKRREKRSTVDRTPSGVNANYTRYVDSFIQMTKEVHE